MYIVYMYLYSWLVIDIEDSLKMMI